MTELRVNQAQQKLSYEDQNQHFFIAKKLDDESLILSINGQECYIRLQDVSLFIKELRHLSL